MLPSFNLLTGVSASALMSRGGGGSGDPYWSNVVLLCSFDSSNEAVDADFLTDKSSRKQTLSLQTGSGHIRPSTDSRFGTTAITSSAVTTSGGVLVSGDAEDFNFGDQPFTIEFWAKRYNLSSANRVFLAVAPNTSSRSFLVGSTSNDMRFYLSTNGTSWAVTLIDPENIPTDWTHYAIDRDNTGKVRLYRNGVMVASATPVGAIWAATPANPLVLGYSPVQPNIYRNFYPTIVDELRVTKGVARYASDAGFTPPTEPYPS